jgi:hypothetical protein
MNTHSVLIEDEVKSTGAETASPFVDVPGVRQDMTPDAIRTTVVALILAFLYLAISGAWLWSAMYRYQNCL